MIKLWQAIKFVSRLQGWFHIWKSLWGAWLAQSVKGLTLTSAQVTISRLLGFNPTLGLCADSAESAWDSLSPCLPVPPPLTLFIFLKTNK